MSAGVEPMTSVTPMVDEEAPGRRHRWRLPGQDRRATRLRPRTISFWCRRSSNKRRPAWPRETASRMQSVSCDHEMKIEGGVHRPDDWTPSVTDLTHLTLAEARDGLKAKRFSAPRLAQAHVDADREGAGAQRLSCWRRRSRRSPWRQASRRAARRRARAGRSKACRSASRICSAPRACARPRAPNILDDFDAAL